MAAAAQQETRLLDEDNLDLLYEWLDQIPYTRSRKNLPPDFSDAILVAEIVSFHFPKFVDLHNYYHAHSTLQKKINWNTLSRKVLTRLNIQLSEAAIAELVESKPGAVEQLLWEIRRRIIALPPGKAGPAPPPSQDDLEFSSSSIDVANEESYIQLTSHNGINALVLEDNTEAPSQILYRGQKMVPFLMIALKLKENEALASENDDLQKKSVRLDTLIDIKDKRVQKLMNKCHLVPNEPRAPVILPPRPAPVVQPPKYNYDDDDDDDDDVTSGSVD